MVAAVALKVADNDPAGIATDAGTLSRELLDESVTVTPPAGAAALRVSVQLLTAPEERVEGEH